MEARLIFFLLFSYPLWMTVSGALVGLEEADPFVSVFGSFFKPRSSVVLEVPCKSTKRMILVLVGDGEGEEERILVGRLEEGATVCSSSDSTQSTSNIDQTPPETPVPFDCVGDHDDGRRREGPGGGGSGPGGGGDDPDGDYTGNGAESNGDEENLGLDELNKFAKISFYITVQTAVSLIGFPKEKASTTQKVLLYMAVGMDMCAYIFCFMAMLLRRKKSSTASIMTVIGTSCAAFGFLLTMCLIFPSNFWWVIAVASVVLLTSVFILFISYK